MSDCVGEGEHGRVLCSRTPSVYKHLVSHSDCCSGAEPDSQYNFLRRDTRFATVATRNCLSRAVASCSNAPVAEVEESNFNFCDMRHTSTDTQMELPWLQLRPCTRLQAWRTSSTMHVHCTCTQARPGRGCRCRKHEEVNRVSLSQLVACVASRLSRRRKYVLVLVLRES